MKKINCNTLKQMLVATIVLLMATACNEKLHIVEENRDAPFIENFEPKNGIIGSEIHITGENLSKVDSIKIGGVKVVVQRLNRKKVIANVNPLKTTDDVVGGIIEVFTPYGIAKTTDSYTVDYVEPILELGELKLNNVSPKDAIIIPGYYLNFVTGVFFVKEGFTNRSALRKGNPDLVEAAILGQAEGFLKVQVPYFEGKVTGIVLSYRSGKNIIETEPMEFPSETGNLELVLKKPQISVVTEKKIQGFEVELEGTDLSVVDSVMIGGLKAEIQTAKSTNTKLVCLLSEHYSETVDAGIKLMYYNEEGNTSVDQKIRVIKPNCYFWRNKTLYSGNMPNTDIGILSGVDGKIYSTCEFAGSEEIKKRAHLGVAAVSGGLAFISMLDNKYLKCGGESLKGGLYMRFRKLSSTVAEERVLLEMIRNKTFEDFEPMDQILNLCQTTVTAARYKANDDVYNVTDAQGMEIGGVNMAIVYKGTDTKSGIAQIGFIELIDAATTSPTVGSLTVNFYLKDVVSE